MRARRRAIALWTLAAVVCLAGFVKGQEAPPPWQAALAKLASSLSEDDSPGALEVFDSSAPHYGALSIAVEALTAQAEVLCAIDVVEEKDADGAKLLDTDWYLQLKAKADGGPSERRRKRVRLILKEIRGKWKIVSLAPIEIFDPIYIR